MRLFVRRGSQEDQATAPVRRGGFRRAGRMLWVLLSWSAVLAAVGALVGVLALISVPRVMGWQGMVILSGSMEPALPTGGIAFVEPVSPSQIKPSDILTYRPAGARRTVISHRVVSVSQTPAGPQFQTKGDANDAPDKDPVTARQVVGVVRSDLPYLGYLVEKLRTGRSYYLVIGIPAALLILNELWNVASEVRKERERRATTSSAEGASS